MQPVVDLSKFDNAWYDPGAGPLTRVLWYLVNGLMFDSRLMPFSMPKRVLLRWFGAQVGSHVLIRPNVNIKYPWRVIIGDHSWIGEGVWLDSLDQIRIGHHVCISQGAYLLTGSHDYKRTDFNLIVRPISIEDGAWVGARAIVCPGTTMRAAAVLMAGSVLSREAEPSGVYRGNPANRIRSRTVSDQHEAAGDIS